MPSSPVPSITSTRNRRIVEVRKLAQRKYRQRQRRFLVEGLQLLLMALEAGIEPLEVYYCPEMVAEPPAMTLLAHLEHSTAELIPVDARVMATLSERDAPQGIVATFGLLDAALDDIPTTGRCLVLILDRLQDPGNLGTLIRTADAVGAAGVVLIEPCVDPFDPKTVRGSMGSLFNLPLVRVSAPHDVMTWAHNRGLHIVGADAHRGAPWGGSHWQGSVALVLGNEARGLSDDVQPHIEAWVHLPMVGKAESLNVAVAGGVLMYRWLETGLAPETREASQS